MNQINKLNYNNQINKYENISNDVLMQKINYMIHLLEEKQDEKFIRSVKNMKDKVIIPKEETPEIIRKEMEDILSKKDGKKYYKKKSIKRKSMKKRTIRKKKRSDK